jgi:predicted aspartyl protease
MGETFIHFKVYGIEGKSAELEGVADTGATFTKIPEPIATELKLEVIDEIQVEIGNKQVITRKLTKADVELEGILRTIYITIGRKGERPLLGYTALEIFGFRANPITGKLEKVVAIE